MKHRQDDRRGFRRPRQRRFLAAVAFLAGAIPALAAPGRAAVPAPAAAAPTPAVEQLVAEALQRNPELLMLRAEADAAQAAVPQAGALPDPMLMVAYFPAMGGLVGGVQMVDLVQPIPYAGKRGARTQQASSALALARHRVREGEQRVREQVQSQYAALVFLDRAAALLEGNRAILQQIERIARTQYEVGKGSQSDVLRAQLEVSRLLDQVVELRAQRPGTLAALNALLARPVTTPLATPMATGQMGSAESAIPSDETLTAATAHRPSVELWAEQVRWWELQVRLAELDRKPDFQVGARAMAMDTNERAIVGVTFGLNLPIYSGRKQHQAVIEAKARLTAAKAALEQARLQAAQEVIAQAAMVRGLDERLTILRTGLLPQAQANAQAALSAYQVGQADFLTLMDRELDVIHLQSDQHRLLRDRAQALAMLEAAVGLPVAEWPKGDADGHAG